MDAEVRRLDDRIDAAKTEAGLRVDVAFAKIYGKLDALVAGVSAGRTWAQVNIAVTVALFTLAVGMMIGLKQVWTGGVQVGQTVRSQTVSPPK